MKVPCKEHLVDGMTGGPFAEIYEPVADLWVLRLGCWGSSCRRAVW